MSNCTSQHLAFDSEPRVDEKIDPSAELAGDFGVLGVHRAPTQFEYTVEATSEGRLYVTIH